MRHLKILAKQDQFKSKPNTRKEIINIRVEYMQNRSRWGCIPYQRLWENSSHRRAVLAPTSRSQDQPHITQTWVKYTAPFFELTWIIPQNCEQQKNFNSTFFLFWLVMLFYGWLCFLFSIVCFVLFFCGYFCLPFFLDYLGFFTFLLFSSHLLSLSSTISWFYDISMLVNIVSYLYHFNIPSVSLSFICFCVLQFSRLGWSSFAL